MTAPTSQPDLPSKPPTRTGPYQGLIPYSARDAAWFFGRERSRSIVLDNLLAYRVSVLYGPSGVGKSSLLHAGVARHVHDAGRRRIEAGDSAEHAAIVYGTWAPDPVAGVKAAIRNALEQLSPALAGDLPDGSLAELVSAASQRLDGTLLIILDQFEEYFLYHAADGPFIDELVRTLARRDAGASVLVSIREDALAVLDVLTGRMPSLLDNLIRVEHLDREAARAAIEQPLELWNREHARPGHPVSIEPALVEAILDGVQMDSAATSATGVADRAAPARTSIQTPYLQLVLVRVWEEEQREGSDVLRLRTLTRLHGAEQIVATHVDTAMARMSAAEQSVAAKVMRQLVTASGTKIALHSADLAEYAELDEATVVAVLERLTREARILQAIGDSRYEIYHDALARPILDWRRRWHADQDRARERRRTRITASIAACGLCIVAAIAVLALLAVRGRDDARRQAADAGSVALASASSDQLRTQPDVALLLALAALRTKDRPEAHRAMLAAREAAGAGAALGIMRGHAKAVNAVAFAQQGRLIASAGDDGRILFWDAATHRRRGPAISLGGAVSGMAVTRNGRTLAAGADDGTIGIWDVDSRRRLATIRVGPYPVVSLALSPDGRTLASNDEAFAAIRLWDLRSLRAPRPHGTIPVRGVSELEFSPDGRALAYIVATAATTGGPVSWRSTVGLRSVTSHRALRRPLIRHVQLRDIAFSPDGRTLAIGGDETWLWHLDTARRRRIADGVAALAVSADGRRLATAGSTGNVRIFDLKTGQRLSEPLTGPVGGLRTIAFSPDGRTLAAAGDDAKVWLLDAGFPPVLGPRVEEYCDAVLRAGGVAFEPACSRFTEVAIDPNGRVLAAAGGATIELVDAHSLRATGPPLLAQGKDAVVASLAFSPDGRTLAAGGERVRLWDWRTRRVSATLPAAGLTDAVSMAFSADGRLLAAADSEGRIALWIVRTHRALPAAPPRVSRLERALAFSPDGRLLASTSNDPEGIALWSPGTRRQVAATRTDQNPATVPVAFSPDGVTVATAAGATITLRDVPSLRSRGQLASRQTELASLAFTPDGRELIAGGFSGIELFDPDAMRPIGTILRGDGLPVMQVAANPDGTGFASAHGINARVWPGLQWRSPDELEHDTCARVGTALRRSEWARYAPGVPYRALCRR